MRVMAFNGSTRKKGNTSMFLRVALDDQLWNFQFSEALEAWPSSCPLLQ